MTVRSCPVPFDGETLFSLVTRVYLRGTFRSAHTALARLGLKNSRLLAAPLGGRFISRVFQAFPEFGHVLNMEVLVRRHTTSLLLLAFSKRCSDPARQAEVITAISERGGWGGAPRSSVLFCPDSMRLCAECCEQDRHEKGIAFWHREHQVKFVTRCWRHRTRLKEVKEVIGQGYALELPESEAATDVSIPEPVREGAGVLLAAAVAAVLNACHWKEPAQVRKLFMARAHELGLLHRGHPSRARIWTRMKETYGAEFLGAVGLPTSYSHGVVKRYIAPFSSGKARLDPGIVLLMGVALGVDPEELCQADSDGRFNEHGAAETDASASLQPAEDEELKRALEDAGYILQRASTALGIHRTQLIRRIFKAGIQCPIVQGSNAKYSEEEIREMMEMLRKGVPRVQIKQRFSCASSFLDQIPIYDPTLRTDAMAARNQHCKVENREAVERYIREHPDSPKSKLREALPGPLSYLDRHDKAWLCAVLNGLPKQPSKTRHPNAGRGRVDDDEFDCAVVGRLSVAKDQMLQLDPPRRITVSLAFRVAEVPKTAYGRLVGGRLPRTEAWLQQVTETDDAYAERKLRYALQHVAKSRSTLTTTSLRTASGFPRAKLEQHQVAIRRVAEEMGLPLHSRSKRVLA